MSNATREVKEIAPIKVVAVNPPKFQKGTTLSAELHQLVTVKSYYPAMKINNSLSENLFKNEEFGEETEEQEFTSTSDRTAFMLVPAGTTIEEVQKRIDALGVKGWIYRILSNHPILSSEHKSAIANGITTKDAIAESQAIRYPETDPDGNPHPKAKELILDQNGKIQYKVQYFTTTQQDIDNRTADPLDMYASPTLEQELGQGTTVFSPEVIETAMQTA